MKNLKSQKHLFLKLKKIEYLINYLSEDVKIKILPDSGKYLDTKN